MTYKQVDSIIEERGLVESIDPETDKTIYRKPSFEGVELFEDIDRRLGDFIREARVNKNLTHEHFVELIGLSYYVYGRYERAKARMTVRRLVHVWELLGFSPIDFMYTIAPQMFGETPEKAERMKSVYSSLEGFKDYLSDASPEQVTEFTETMTAMSRLPVEALRTMNLFFKQMNPIVETKPKKRAYPSRRKKAEATPAENSEE